MNISELNSRIAIPGIRFTAGLGGLTCADITTPAAAARIYLHGAHITHWQPANHEPVLFLSNAAIFAEGKAIRGGVPICHPWFGPATIGPRASDPAAPAHGLVRALPWDFISAQSGPDHAVTVTLKLRHTSRQNPDVWPFDFEIQLRATFGRSLIIELQTTNTGNTPMPLEEALHTYLAVSDVRQITIDGLDQTEYLDKTRQMARTRQSGPIQFTSETDRVYLNTPATCTLRDPPKRREIRVAKTNSQSTIIWNPAAARAAQLTDIGAEQWSAFACIESANVGDASIQVGAGEQHMMSATIDVAKI